MADIWQAPSEIKKQLEEIQVEHHPHLSQANVWVLCSDGKALRHNRLVATQSRKCTKTEKLSTGNDFKIMIMTEAWATLTDVQRTVALDEALCRCGVKYVPQTVEVNGRKEVVKDDLGRIIYTDEMDYDKDGNPKWCIMPPDAALYFAMIQRHGQYSEDAENAHRANNNLPLKKPLVAIDDSAAVAEELEALGV